MMRLVRLERLISDEVSEVGEADDFSEVRQVDE